MAERPRARGARILIREVRAENDPAFRAAFRLLARLFHTSELLPWRAWTETMRERQAGLWTDLNWHLLVAERKARGAPLVGVASGSYLGNVNVGVVGYVAVVHAVRHLGLGPRLRLALRRAFERDARRIRRRPLEALVGEVRADNPWLRHLVLRRGALPLDFPYYQPSLRGRRDRAVPLVLYYQPLWAPRASVPASLVRRLLYTIWRRMYRVPSPLTRPAFRRMLRALAGRGRIGRRRLVPRRSVTTPEVA